MSLLRRPVGLAGAVVMLLGWGLAAASCRGVLGLDDFAESSTVLCEQLAKCYATRTLSECGARVETKLDDAEPESRAGWLAAFSDRACLESCSSARRCLDLLPVCDGQSCVVKEDCCGFVGGRTDCDSDTGKCCRRKGIACSSDEQCCPGAGSCSEITNTCGGVVCVPAGGVCLNDYECCTGRCDDFSCAETICNEDGFECGDDADCCSGFCNPATSTCGKPTCGVLGDACSDATPCCSGLQCHLGVCSTGECFPPGNDCVTDQQCCSGFCDPQYYLCGLDCKDQGEPCVEGGECCGGVCEGGACTAACSTGACTVDSDCCSGVCNAGVVCAPDCKAGDCNHSACTVGGPLQPGCDAGCVDAVCQADPFCCCIEWDSLCVSEALQTSQCSTVCG